MPYFPSSLRANFAPFFDAVFDILPTVPAPGTNESNELNARNALSSADDSPWAESDFLFLVQDISIFRSLHNF